MGSADTPRPGTRAERRRDVHKTQCRPPNIYEGCGRRLWLLPIRPSSSKSPQTHTFRYPPRHAGIKGKKTFRIYMKTVGRMFLVCREKNDEVSGFVPSVCAPEAKNASARRCYSPHLSPAVGNSSLFTLRRRACRVGVHPRVFGVCRGKNLLKLQNNKRNVVQNASFFPQLSFFSSWRLVNDYFLFLPQILHLVIRPKCLGFLLVI